MILIMIANNNKIQINQYLINSILMEYSIISKGNRSSSLISNKRSIKNSRMPHLSLPYPKSLRSSLRIEFHNISYQGKLLNLASHFGQSYLQILNGLFKEAKAVLILLSIKNFTLKDYKWVL